MKKKVGQRKQKFSKKESFFMEFAAEIDLFPLSVSFPEWIYDYREDILNRVRSEFRVMCQILKDAGIKFYVKYLVEIDGKWKFADVYIPERRMVILIINDYETIGLPCHSKTNRELWFGDRFKTVAVCTYEVKKVLDKVKQ